MIMNGTKSRESHRLIALLLLSLGTVVGCGAEAEPSKNDAVQAGAAAVANTTAPSAGAAGRPASGQAGSASSATMATTPRTAAGGAGATAAQTTGAATAGTAAAPTAGTAAAGTTASAGPDETPAAAGAGGAAAGADGSTAGAAGTPAEAPREDLGKGDGSDVIAIGDSWMNLGTTGIQQSLVRLSMQPYRTYGVPGVRLLDEVIPNQYASAKRANPDIKTGVMTGGGNDILLTGAGADRSTAGPATTAQIDKVADRLVELWKEMGSDGVKDIVYIEYSRGGQSEAAINYATEKVKPLCEAAEPARCHWIDADDFLMKMLSFDGIHPTGDGCDKIATGVIALMEKEGLRR